MMMSVLQASGVGVQDECLRVYDEVKLGHRWLYVIFRVSESLQIVVEEKGGHGRVTPIVLLLTCKLNSVLS